MVRRILTVMGLFAFILASIALPGCQTNEPSVTSTGSDTSTEQQAVQTILPSISEVVAKVEPAVVAINVELIAYDFFGRPVKIPGAGSGWIIDKDGYIVTNNHVVEGAQTINVTLQDGRVFSAEQVSTDPTNDLAVIKINAYDLPTITVGDSSILAVGDWVVAIGNSLGMGISATVGVVSALNVSLTSSSGEKLIGLVQTDAAVNPGNSGGPLVNMAGEVIGITSAKIAEVGVEGMGYAISINKALPVIQNLISNH